MSGAIENPHQLFNYNLAKLTADFATLRVSLVDNTTNPKLFRVREAAANIGVSPKTIHRWIKSGQLEHIRIGSTIRVVIRDVRLLPGDAVKGAADGGGK